MNHEGTKERSFYRGVAEDAELVKEYCVHFGCHSWLVQQWTPGTRFALLDKPAVAPGTRLLVMGNADIRYLLLGKLDVPFSIHLSYYALNYHHAFKLSTVP